MNTDRITIESVYGILLTNWEVVRDGDITYLKGTVYRHPNYRDGELITTSELVKIAGKIAETSSGRKYTLGNEKIMMA